MVVMVGMDHHRAVTMAAPVHAVIGAVLDHTVGTVLDLS